MTLPRLESRLEAECFGEQCLPNSSQHTLKNDRCRSANTTVKLGRAKRSTTVEMQKWWQQTHLLLPFGCYCALFIGIVSSMSFSFSLIYDSLIIVFSVARFFQLKDWELLHAANRQRLSKCMHFKRLHSNRVSLPQCLICTCTRFRLFDFCIFLFSLFFIFWFIIFESLLTYFTH